MGFEIGGFGALIAGGFIVIGFIIGSSTMTPATVAGENEKIAECRGACNQYDQRRQERCNAEKDEQSAFQKALALIAANAGVLAAAVTATILANGFLWAILIAGVLWALYFISLGIMAAAIQEHQEKVGASKKCRDAEAEARGLMIAECSPEEVDSCLLRPYPC